MDTGRGSLFDGAEAGQLWVQFYGVVATFVVVFICRVLIVFAAIKYTIGLRVSEEQEMLGLDISRARDVRLPRTVHRGLRRRVDVLGASRRPRDERIGKEDDMKKIEAFIRHEAFETIRDRSRSMGLPSMSVSEVKGSGPPGRVHRDLPRCADHGVPSAEAEVGDRRR